MPDFVGRDKTAGNEIMFENVGNPLGIALVGFLSANSFDVLGVSKDNVTRLFKYSANLVPQSWTCFPFARTEISTLRLLSILNAKRQSARSKPLWTDLFVPNKCRNSALSVPTLTPFTRLVLKSMLLFLLLPKTSDLRLISFLPFRVSKPLRPLPLSPKSAWICPCSRRRNISVLGRDSSPKTMRAPARRKPLVSPVRALSSNLCLCNALSPFATPQSTLKSNTAIFCSKSVVGTRKRLLLFAGCCLPLFTPFSNPTLPTILISTNLTTLPLRNVFSRSQPPLLY